MQSAIRCGATYALVVFAIGFVLGVVRSLFIAPYIGALAAVALELPFMVVASWYVCRSLVGAVDGRLVTRAAMGATALLTLLLLELGAAMLLAGQGPTAFGAALVTPEGLLGLAGQVTFGVLPLVIGRRP